MLRQRDDAKRHGHMMNMVGLIVAQRQGAINDTRLGQMSPNPNCKNRLGSCSLAQVFIFRG